MHGTSDDAQNGRNDGRSEQQPEGATPARETKPRETTSNTPVVDSPPTSPPTSPPASPWWTAPGGKAVDIPAFGRMLLDTLMAMLASAPQPIAIRIRAKR